MLKTTRSRVMAILAAVAVVLAGVLVPVAANAAVTYPTAAPGALSIDQIGTSTLQYASNSFPSGTTFGAVQWYRGSTAISGATGNAYMLTEADHDKLIKVRVTFTVPGFAATSRYSPAGSFTFTRSGILSLTGVGQVGTQLGVSDLMEFRDPSDNLQDPDRWYQWRVNGVAYGAPTPDPQLMTVLEEHFGKTITCTVLVENFGIAPQTYSPNVPIKITMRQPIQNANNAAAVVTKTTNGDGSFSLLASVTDEISQAGTSGPTYQWYRANYLTGAVTTLTGKTSATYVPTAADYPYRIFVRATFTLAGFQPLVLESYRHDYSVRAENRRVPGPVVVGGQAAAIYDYSYENYDADDINDRTYVSVGEDVTHRWMRNGATVTGETDYYYPVTKTDLGKTLSYAVTVKKDGYLSGVNLVSSASPKVLGGTLNFSSLGSPVFTVNPDTMKVTVAPTGSTFPESTVTKVQWRRNGVVVYTGTAYQLTAADYGKELSALMTYSAPGYASDTVTSQVFKPWVKASAPVPVLGGPQCVDCTVTINERTFTDADDNPVSTYPATYQWLRNGTAIPGAVSETYQLDQADEGKSISVRMTVTSDGLLPSISTSAPTGIIGDQTLEGAYDQANVTIITEGTETAPILRADSPGSTGITGPAGLMMKYQWFRAGVAVSGATKATYAVTSADRLKPVHVRVTTTHAPVSGQTYTSNIKTSIPVDYTIRTTTSTITGSPVVGGELYYDSAVATGNGPLSGYSLTYEWLRNGVAIPGTDSQVFNVTSADVGKRISMRATFVFNGYLALTTTTTTPASVLITAAPFDLGTVHPAIEWDDIGTLKAVIPSGISPTPTSYTYQWLRNGVAISKATGATYKLVTADAGKSLTLRVTAVRPGYTSTQLPITPAWIPDIIPSGPPTVTAGTHKVGDTIGVTLPSYSTDAFAVTSVFATYRWLRNGKLISGQTGNTYTLGSADLNTSIQAQVTATLEGHLARTDTSAGTFPIAKGVTTTPPTAVVSFNSATQTLTASIEGMVPAGPAPSLTYQWYRGATKISGATKSTYKPVTADIPAELSVQIKVNRGSAFSDPIFTATSVGENYQTFHGDGNAPLTISGTAKVGEVLTADFIPYVNDNGDAVGASITRTWYRNGVAITGATNLASATYTVQAADLNKTITVRETATSPVTLRLTTPPSAGVGPVTAGTLTGSFGNATVAKNSSGSLVPTITPGTIDQPGPYLLSYRWERDGAPISGATKSTYKLTSADTGKDVRVWITVGKAGYTTSTTEIVGLANWLKPVDDEVQVTQSGAVLTATPPTFTAPGNPTVSLAYQWYTGGSTLIEGADSAVFDMTGMGPGPFTVRVVASAQFYFGLGYPPPVSEPIYP